MHTPLPIVYIVDDDESVRKALSRLMHSMGMRPESFASAQEFLDHGYEETGACLILDIRLPGMDGLDLQERLLGAGSRLPMIFVTAHHDREKEARARRNGAVAYLTKPFDDEVLREGIRLALGQES